MLKLILSALLLSSPALAQSPTIVYGASEDAPGKPDSYLVIQPDNNTNPLGNPMADIPPASSAESELAEPTALNQNGSEQIPSAAAKINQDTPDQTLSATPEINQTAPQNPQPFSESPEQEQDQIQNSLYQGGNRIYDVQSYPVQDIKTITEPNVQPTITTYPEY